jgi:sialic acid synthase SpsE
MCAVAAGAQIIEKHFKIDNDFECIDAKVSITENQMIELVKNIRRIERIFGKEEFGVRDIEKTTMQFKRKS